jgi:hypothetical protein
MTSTRTGLIIAFLLAHPAAYAEEDRSDATESNSVYEQMFALNDLVGGTGATTAYDWSYNNSMLFAASSVVAQNSMAAQSGGGGSGSSSDSSDDDDAAEAGRYASIGDRENGEHVKDDDGSKKIWPHKLPFLGQKVISLGYDLPDPYGVALIGSYVEQSLQISNLRVSTSGTDRKSVV